MQIIIICEHTSELIADYKRMKIREYGKHDFQTSRSIIHKGSRHRIMRNGLAHVCYDVVWISGNIYNGYVMAALVKRKELRISAESV